MPRILSFDTSSEACSVYLEDNGEHCAEFDMAPRQHAQRLLPMIKSVLESRKLSPRELDAIAFSRGPGSFTGLRIAAGVAQGLSYGSDCGVLAVSNLEAIALSACENTTLNYILVVLDARMDEVYCGLFEITRDLGGMSAVKLVGEESVTSPEKMRLHTDQAVYAVGSGLEFVERFPASVQKQITSRDVAAVSMAEDIARVALRDFKLGVSLLTAREVRPSYIRDTVAWKKLPGRE
jgi:tRNA threonylcarbamoyladenosine biosynthesis protein TsaB